MLFTLVKIFYMNDDGNEKNSSFICCLNNHKRDACGSGRLKHPFDGKNDVTDIDQDEIK